MVGDTHAAIAAVGLVYYLSFCAALRLNGLRGEGIARVAQKIRVHVDLSRIPGVGAEIAVGVYEVPIRIYVQGEAGFTRDGGQGHPYQELDVDNVCALVAVEVCPMDLRET